MPLSACKDRQQTGNLARLPAPYGCLGPAGPSMSLPVPCSYCSAETGIKQML